MFLQMIMKKLVLFAIDKKYGKTEMFEIVE